MPSTVAVRLSPDAVMVKYTLEVGWFTMHLDGARLLTPEDISKLDKTERGYATAYAKKSFARGAGKYSAFGPQTGIATARRRWSD